MTGHHLKRVAALLMLTAPVFSCAYYNTFYLARREYERATAGAPYVQDKPDGAAMTHFNKSIEYSKKLLSLYPKSKWVDDAYLLWARGLMGKEDPLQTMSMLRDFPARYPQSTLKDEALFYLGAGGRKARKYAEALLALDEFLQRAPQHDLAPYAWMERARVLVALERPGEAAEAATVVLERFPKNPEGDRALRLRAEALLAEGEHDRARGDYRLLGMRADTEEERFGFLLKEADCLEAGRRYDEVLALLQSAISHEQEPQRPVASPTGQTSVVQANPGSADRWARLTLRIGTAQTLAGRKDLAIGAYRRVIEYFPRTQHAAEAQYRLAYVHETVSDDFDTARTEYAKVQTQAPGSAFALQASTRLATLDRLVQYRAGAGPDSIGKKAEAGFLLAEQYLFQLDKPDRAIEEYRKIARDHRGTPHAGKALNAEAWVLRNKYKMETESDSLLWVVVRDYPKTEAQVDARDYLERFGHRVPPEMIQLPEPKIAPADTTPALSPLPVRPDSLGARRMPASMDSLLRYGTIRAGDPPRAPSSTAAPRDSARSAPPIPAPSVPPVPSAPRDTVQAVVDSLRGVVPAKPDTVARPR